VVLGYVWMTFVLGDVLENGVVSRGGRGNAVSHGTPWDIWGLMGRGGASWGGCGVAKGACAYALTGVNLVVSRRGAPSVRLDGLVFRGFGGCHPVGVLVGRPRGCRRPGRAHPSPSMPLRGAEAPGPRVA